jgi:two-component system, cell cycle response regulator
MLTLFDLNGFKNHNDTFGHPAGDALLLRLGIALERAVTPFAGRAYRRGGDEFCVIADATRREAVEAAACEALSESGEGFAVSTAFGSVVLPHEATDAAEAMRKADEAMYAQKHSGRASAGRQSSDVLLRALAERHPDLGDHLDGVAELAAEVARRLGIDGEELVQLRHAAALHDIGKVAIPDAIITKPAPLNEEEWAFMRRHTVIGERIIAAAPALGGAARLARGLRRQRLPTRPRRRRDSPRRPHHRRLRRVRRDDLRAPVLPGQERATGARRAHPLRRHAVRSRDRPRVSAGHRRPLAAARRRRPRLTARAA